MFDPKYEYYRWSGILGSRIGVRRVVEMILALLPAYKHILDKNGWQIISPDGNIVISEMNNIQTARRVLDVFNEIHSLGMPTLATPTILSTGEMSSQDGPAGFIPLGDISETDLKGAVSEGVIDLDEIRSKMKAFQTEFNDKLHELAVCSKGILKIRLCRGKIELTMVTSVTV